MSDLNTQAAEAVARIMVETGSHLDSYEAQLARLAWLDGHKAGLAAVKALANDNFARLRAELS